MFGEEQAGGFCDPAQTTDGPASSSGTTEARKNECWEHADAR